ncbi:MAG TPA: hypothetical protein VNW52_05685 [Burkholderiaceae bacterium]|jgi:hypothetical protein|nr:hypothetical protein [Burkholderiaceae bacterium]
MRTLRLAICLLVAVSCISLTLPAGAATLTQESDPAQKRFLKIIEALQTGSLQFPDTEAPMVEALTQQAPQLAKTLAWLGKLESVNLLRTRQGERVYELWFVNGRTVWGVAESPAGKIASMRLELRQHR